MNKLTICISNEAQKQELIAGRSASRVQVYTVPTELLPRFFALPWARIDAQGEAVCEIFPDMSYRPTYNNGSWIGDKFAANTHVHHAGYNMGSIECSVAHQCPRDAEGAIAWAEDLIDCWQREHAAELKKIEAVRRAKNLESQIKNIVEQLCKPENEELANRVLSLI